MTLKLLKVNIKFYCSKYKLDKLHKMTGVKKDLVKFKRSKLQVEKHQTKT